MLPGSALLTLLAAGAPARAPEGGDPRTERGGVVVYSTCTINAAESEDVVDAVVADGDVEVDAWLGDEWPSFRHRTRTEFLQTLPHVDDTSGFFVARLIVA